MKPYNRFLMTECFLIPLSDINFRDDPNIIAFKYGGKISIMGYVTNIIDNGKEATKNNKIASLYEMINKAMLGLFNDKQKVYIVHPIALYS
jgi:hypothetical protein